MSIIRKLFVANRAEIALRTEAEAQLRDSKERYVLAQRGQMTLGAPVAWKGINQFSKAVVEASLDLAQWRAQINRLPTDTLWQTQARASARDDVYSIASQVTRSLLSRKESIATWRGQHEQAIAKLNQLLTTITTQGADLAPVSVALRELRSLA